MTAFAACWHCIQPLGNGVELVARQSVLVLVGSTREESRTAVLAECVVERLREVGARASVWSACDRPLPIVDPAFHSEPEAHPDDAVRWLVSEASDSSGIILASPLYHNSYSGVLKNALDHLSMKQVAFKPVCLLGHGGNRSTQAVDHLRTVVRGLLGVPTPTAICTQSSDFEVADRIMLCNMRIEQRCVRAATELLLMSTVLSTKRDALMRNAGL